jgi:hypothetical protein
LAALSTLAALLSALAGLLGLLSRLLAALLPAALLPAVLTTLARLLRLLARPLTRVLIGVVHWERSCVRLVQAFNTGERQLFRLDGTMLPTNVDNRSLRLGAVVAAGMGARLERIFERRIPVAAAVAAGHQQPERDNGENHPGGPHALLPLRRRSIAFFRPRARARPCQNRERSLEPPARGA